MTHLTPALCGFALDLLLADPDWMPHPVVCMGKAIDALEKKLRASFPQTPEGEPGGGAAPGDMGGQRRRVPSGPEAPSGGGVPAGDRLVLAGPGPEGAVGGEHAGI